ncbi:MAG: bifunctional DNA primase/polymerase [Candidatus Paceibacterota bacterium]
MENNITNKKLEAALRYTAMGWVIVPAIGKHPCVKWKKFQKVKPTQDQIKEFWTKFPNAKIAVITGPLSSIVVFDIDTKHNRRPEEFDLPATVSSRTTNGGWHYFFKHPGYKVRNSNGTLFGPGIDIKGDSGIAILPSSDTGPDKAYTWAVESTGDNMAPMPKWLEDRISSAQSTPTLPAMITSNEVVLTNKIGESSLNEIPEGTRNDKLTKLTGTLLAKFKPNEWNSLVWPIVTSFNTANCKPPLPLSEVKSIFDSISGSEMSKPSMVNTGPIEILTAKELKELPFTDPKWVVDGLFEAGTVNMIGAAYSNFKSMISMHVADCLITGKPVFNKFEVVKQSVWVINEEDPKRHVQERMNIINSDWGELPIYFSIKKGLKLSDDIVGQIIVRSKALGIGFVIFDSLRSVHDKEENASGEMQAVMDWLGKIADAGITVLFTHHNRKRSGFGKANEGEEARGSSVITNASHSYISSNAKKENGMDYAIIMQHKQKSAKKLDPFRIRINLLPDCDNDERFIYEGEEINNSLVVLKAKIIGALESSEKWLFMNDFTALKFGGKKTIKKALDELVLEERIECKLGEEIIREELDASIAVPRPNAKFYFLANEE